MRDVTHTMCKPLATDVHTAVTCRPAKTFRNGKGCGYETLASPARPADMTEKILDNIGKTKLEATIETRTRRTANDTPGSR